MEQRNETVGENSSEFWDGRDHCRSLSGWEWSRTQQETDDRGNGRESPGPSLWSRQEGMTTTRLALDSSLFVHLWLKMRIRECGSRCGSWGRYSESVEILISIFQDARSPAKSDDGKGCWGCEEISSEKNFLWLCVVTMLTRLNVIISQYTRISSHYLAHRNTMLYVNYTSMG